MQNCRHQLSRYWSIVAVVVLAPLLLYATFFILPTFDDWTTLTKPDFNPLFIKERFLFFGYHWRPFDSIIGYILGRDPMLLYPAFNHILVVVGHVICTFLIYHLTSTLGFSRLATNIVTFFFFIAPATMATVLAVDSMNQTYALLWGMVAFFAYIKLKRAKYFRWIVLVFIATLCKENGLMWALICPILAYGFDFINQKTLKKDLLIGIGIMIAYALIILVFPKDIIIHPEYEPGVTKVLKSIVKFLLTSFITVDYIYLLHQPSRNLLLAAISFLLAVPFTYYAFTKAFRSCMTKKIVCIILSLLIAVAPHVFTVFSMMHTYAGLPMVVLLIAYSIDSYGSKIKPIIISFLLFVITSLIIDFHLWDESVKGGLLGKQMAQEAIRKTGKPVNNVYVVIIEDDYPKLSSFCVIPIDAFGWGLATQYETNYQWPITVKDTTIERSVSAASKVKEIAKDVLKSNSYDCVWIVDHKNIDVVK